MPRPSYLVLACLLGVLAMPAAKWYATTKETQANERKWAPVIRAAESAYSLPTGLLHRLLFRESHFRTDIITGATRSKAGAAGIAQFMPATAAEMGVDPLNPAQAIDGAARYLSRLYRQFNEWPLAVAAYNAGPGNVKKYGGIPPFKETLAYVAAVLRA